MGHSPEPWSFEYDEIGVDFVLDKDGKLVADVPQVKEIADNSRRIVACVNVLQGISTEDLEKFLSLKEEKHVDFYAWDSGDESKFIFFKGQRFI